MMEAENRFHIIVGEDIDRGRSVFNHRRFTSVFHLFVPLTTMKTRFESNREL